MWHNEGSRTAGGSLRMLTTSYQDRMGISYTRSVWLLQICMNSQVNNPASITRERVTPILGISTAHIICCLGKGLGDPRYGASIEEYSPRDPCCHRVKEHGSEQTDRILYYTLARKYAVLKGLRSVDGNVSHTLRSREWCNVAL